MSVFGAAMISFFGFILLATHFERRTLLRIAGYAKYVDIVLHCTVIYLFMGTSTLGLMQAELSAIMFTICLRAFRFLFGYERWEAGEWIKYNGFINTKE